MKTKTINLYSYQELSDEAKKKAHAKWREDNDYMFLENDMNEWLHELLKENKIKDVYGTYNEKDLNTFGQTSKRANVRYSLSYCQGDGVMFEGTFEWEDHMLKITHNGHYYHSHSKIVDWIDQPQSEVQERRFEEIYQKICKELERRGYDYIEYEDSEESFIEACEANDYTFRENGVMENI